MRCKLNHNNNNSERRCFHGAWLWAILFGPSEVVREVPVSSYITVLSSPVICRIGLSGYFLRMDRCTLPWFLYSIHGISLGFLRFVGVF